MHIINQSCSDRCIDDAIACEYELSDPADHHLLEILQELGEVTTRNLGTLILFSCEKDGMKFKGMTGDALILGSVPKSSLVSADIFLKEITSLYTHRRSYQTERV